MAWVEFIAALLTFFVSHSVPVRPRIRARLVDRFGARGFTIGYSALSLAVLVWVIGAAGRAPHVAVWRWAPWQNHLVLLVMAGVVTLLALSIGRSNPFSFGGARNDRFDPERAGAVRVLRHPLLMALGPWAFAHMVPNGDVAHQACAARDIQGRRYAPDPRGAGLCSVALGASLSVWREPCRVTASLAVPITQGRRSTGLAWRTVQDRPDR